jgi:hypothetical protein
MTSVTVDGYCMNSNPDANGALVDEAGAARRLFSLLPWSGWHISLQLGRKGGMDLLSDLPKVLTVSSLVVSRAGGCRESPLHRETIPVSPCSLQFELEFAISPS